MAYKDPEKGLARGRDSFRRRTTERRAKGLCPRCGIEQPTPGRILCGSCAEKRRLAQRVRDAKRRATGKARYTDPGKQRAHKRQRYRQQTVERLAKGLCPKCGKHRLAPGRRLCDPCGENRRKAERARYPWGGWNRSIHVGVGR